MSWLAGSWHRNRMQMTGHSTAHLESAKKAKAVVYARAGMGQLVHGNIVGRVVVLSGEEQHL